MCGSAFIRFIPACAGNSHVLERIPLGTLDGYARFIVCGVAGSSPRVRGTSPAFVHEANSPCVNPDSFINASRMSVHPRVCGEQCHRETVHPRVCGEQYRAASIQAGSSPRVRGNSGSTAEASLPEVRIGPFTRHPPCAGNRKQRGRTQKVRCGHNLSVHPRVCGEQIHNTSKKNRRWPTRRFIPACAGNRPSPRGKPEPLPVHPRVCGEQHTNWTVHPRVCGEQLSHPRRPNRTAGSSPRVRGTGHICPSHFGVNRFIPACAGNSPARDGELGQRPVHPRVCGEQIHAKEREVPQNGSSPRVRGTGATIDRPPFSNWFIPACAGNRMLPCAASSALSVHPRVCGEQQ